MKHFFPLFLALSLLVPSAFGAQHDYVIDNAPGATVRSDMNSVLQAIVTNNSGSTAPAVTYPNMFWYDTANGALKKRSNADDAWVDILSSIDGAKLTGLANIVSGAGVIPVANLPVGTTASKIVQLDGSAKLPAVDGSALTGIVKPTGSYAAVAWVNFNGTGATPAIRGSGNVSGITDHGNGDWTINFTVAMPDANYATVIAGKRSSDSDMNFVSRLYSVATYTASSVRITMGAPNGAEDSDLVSVVCFR